MVMNGDASLPCRGKMVEAALADKVRPNVPCFVYLPSHLMEFLDPY